MAPFLLWIAFGAFIGWLASLVLASEGRRGETPRDIVIGVLGAGLGGFLFSREMSPNMISFGSVLTALVGAVILLALANILTLNRPLTR